MYYKTKINIYYIMKKIPTLSLLIEQQKDYQNTYRFTNKSRVREEQH